jgi:hypothetical protein
MELTEDKQGLQDRLSEVVGSKYVTAEPFILDSYSADFG